MSRLIELKSNKWIEDICDLNIPWSAFTDLRYPQIQPLLRDHSPHDMGSKWIHKHSTNFIDILISKGMFTPQKLAWYFISADAECSERVLRYIVINYTLSLDLIVLSHELSLIRSPRKKHRMLQVLSAPLEEAQKRYLPGRKRKVRVSNQ